MSTMPSHITGVSIVFSTVCNQRKHQSSASLAFVRGIHRLPFDDVIAHLSFSCAAFNGNFINSGFTNGAVGWVIASNILIWSKLHPCPHRTQNQQCYGFCYAVNILTGIGLTKQRAKFRKALMIDFMMTSSNRNIFCVTDPLCGEFTGHRWIPLTQASDAELRCFLWYAPKQTVEQTIETPVIWDTITPIMASL